MAAIRAVVQGRVQGVGFRAYVRQLAEGLGIDGEVWNRLDGAVELVAQNPEAQRLENLVRVLWSGPGFVSDVHSEPTGDLDLPTGFRIGPTR